VQRQYNPLPAGPDRRIDEVGNGCRIFAPGRNSVRQSLSARDASRLCGPFPGRLHAERNAIQVTPGGGLSLPTLLLTLNVSANAGEIRESFFRFNALAAGALQGASIGLGNPLVGGDGAVTGILDVCAGDFFVGIEPIGCGGTPGTAIAFATAFDSSLQDSVSFSPTSFFDVFVDLTVDGGLDGFASLDTSEVALVTPEPSVTPEASTLLFCTAALFVFYISRTRLRRS
jgi:hypothetical protein